MLLTFLIGCKDRDTASHSNSIDYSRKDTMQLAYSYFVKGQFFFKKNNLDSAYWYYNASKNLSFTAHDSLRGTYTVLRIAEIYYHTADYSASETAITEILPYFEKSKNLEYITAAYNLLGVNAIKRNDYDAALRYYNKSMSHSTDSLKRGIIENNKAGVYIGQGRFQKAITVLTRLNNSSVVANDLTTKARVLNNLGRVYSLSKNSLAEEYLLKALHIRKKEGDTKDLLSSYLQLGKFYSEKDREKALTYASNAFFNAKSIENGDEKLDAVSLLIINSPPKEAKEYTFDYIRLSDSITKARSIAKNQFAKIRYDNKITIEENRNLKIQQEREQAKSRLYFAIAVFITILLFLTYWVLKLIHKREKAKEVYTTEKRLSKTIHDELANDVFRVLSFVETLPGDYANREKLLGELDNVYERTRDISRQNSSIDTGNGYAQTLKDMLSEYKTPTINVLVVNLDNSILNNLSETKKVVLYRILQEFMVNMKKHSEATRVIIKLRKEGSKVKIDYSDNGKGFDIEQLSRKNGLLNAENRISSISGTIIFERISSGGLTIQITFPN